RTRARRPRRRAWLRARRSPSVVKRWRPGVDPRQRGRGTPSRTAAKAAVDPCPPAGERLRSRGFVTRGRGHTDAWGGRPRGLRVRVVEVDVPRLRGRGAPPTGVRGVPSRMRCYRGGAGRTRLRRSAASLDGRATHHGGNRAHAPCVVVDGGRVFVPRNGVCCG